MGLLQMLILYYQFVKALIFYLLILYNFLQLSLKTSLVGIVTETGN